MLYALQDATAQALSPLAPLAQWGAWLAQRSMWPRPLRAQWQAGCQLLERLTRTYEKPAFGIPLVMTPAGEVRVHESVVHTWPFCELRHFAKQQGPRGPKLLIVAPMSGHHATLLRDTVRAMLSEHDVYITDWADAREVPLAAGAFDLSEYTRYVQQCIRALGPDTHVLAVCQPGVPVLAAVSLMEQGQETLVPRSMTLIASPVDTRQSPTAVNRFALEHDLAFFEQQLTDAVPRAYAGAGRRVYPGFLQLTSFVMLNREKHVQAYDDYYHAVARGDEEAVRKHERFYDEYNAVLDLPAEFYLETLAKVFLRAELAEGVLDLLGQRVDPGVVTRVPLMTIEGADDDITGAGQTHAAHALCSALTPAQRSQLTIEGVGHYGAFSGSKFRAQALPAITAFIRAHDAAK